MENLEIVKVRGLDCPKKWLVQFVDKTPIMFCNSHRLAVNVISFLNGVYEADLTEQQKRYLTRVIEDVKRKRGDKYDS